MKIVVLAGGLSPERDVSLSSGSLIANALLENGHEVMLVDLYSGAPENEKFITKEEGRRFSYTIPACEPDLKRLREEAGNGESMVGRNVLELCKKADVVFLSLHGALGENGQLQALFDAYGVRYTGSGYIGSLLAMDKDISKQLMVQNGIKTPRWALVEAAGCEVQRAAAVESAAFPCVVKPCSCGSSVGVSIVENKEELKMAMDMAAQYGDTVLIEQLVRGREFSVGILNGEALPPIEIIPTEGFYDYKNKYQAGLTREVCPAQLTAEQEHTLMQAALKTHRALRLGFYSRVDFILDSGNTPYCLEANSLPGMTPTSLLPQEAAAAGIAYTELCERITRAAVMVK